MPPLAPRLGRRNITPETVRLLWRFTRRMPPNQEAVHGRDAILAQLKAGKDRGFAQVKIAVTAADSSGDIGYGTGTYVAPFPSRSKNFPRRRPRPRQHSKST
jgi:hypothetical protein